MSEVQLSGVTKSFPDGHGGRTDVLHGVDILAPSGEFVVLLGPSGCGKSTSLRIIAGLESATGGDVLIDGERVNDVPAAKRSIAMVFQNYALYPHLSVMENIVFGLRVRRVGRAERQERGLEAARKVGLEAYLDRKPSQLSGGQRQRAALARALVSDAKVVLMDEPLSNLDAKLRHQMRIELRTLQRELGLTVIYVTHDQVEAMTMADHVVVMRDGFVAQAAAPVDLYTEPADTDVASFIGSPPMNLLPARGSDAGLTVSGHPRPWSLDAPVDTDVVVGIRPESLALDGTGPLEVLGRVRTAEVLGAETLLTLEGPGGDTFVARLPGISRIGTGTDVRLTTTPDDLRFFDPRTGRSLTTPASA
ncbi:Maltose maltodextrin transport ATP-binding protein malK [Serinicoccus hydrothermalis]|uniref:Maltose maltodextrin transport ATP-binding protein malK n=1 Tax=Serinicoccus hydrothermalis TaxID=1758689 RepID=A0A1B1N918_9MICO|nr:ATP-binding cassette domain-containing protein [Serinicoccus hydrothermalis]ANS77875.1 Maltose maltodextrin transport ATP-binding protein malK [Serinicoccus hydrothermalis]